MALGCGGDSTFRVACAAPALAALARSNLGRARGRVRGKGGVRED